MLFSGIVFIGGGCGGIGVGAVFLGCGRIDFSGPHGGGGCGGIGVGAVFLGGGRIDFSGPGDGIVRIGCGRIDFKGGIPLRGREKRLTV